MVKTKLLMHDFVLLTAQKWIVLAVHFQINQSANAKSAIQLHGLYWNENEEM